MEMDQKRQVEQVWDKWTVVRELGRGSYGIVYEAVRQEHSVNSRSAIKVISIPSHASELISMRSEMSSDDELEVYLKSIVDNCVKEIQVLESFKGSPGIVTIEDYEVIKHQDSIGWTILIRMELLQPLTHYLLNHQLSEEEVLKLGIDLTSALELCAKNKVLHRDIKPENIFVNEHFGYFKLGDFGIARELENVSNALSQRGTINYMAPEMLRGERLYDERADIYSLGLVLYRLMNQNYLPFLETGSDQTNSTTRMQAINKRLEAAILPRPAKASDALSEVILKACRRDKEERFQTASAFKQALEAVQSGLVLPDFSKNQDLSSVDATVLVRKSENAQHQIESPTVHIQHAPQSTTKRQFFSKNLLVFLVSLVVLTGAGLWAVNAFFYPGTKQVAYSDYDEEKITEALEEASDLEELKDYKGALQRIQLALDTYPNSKLLKSKEREYKQLMEEPQEVSSSSQSSPTSSSSVPTTSSSQPSDTLAQTPVQEQPTSQPQPSSSQVQAPVEVQPVSPTLPHQSQHALWNPDKAQALANYMVEFGYMMEQPGYQRIAVNKPINWSGYQLDGTYSVVDGYEYWYNNNQSVHRYLYVIKPDNSTMVLYSQDVGNTAYYNTYPTQNADLPGAFHSIIYP